MRLSIIVLIYCSVTLCPPQPERQTPQIPPRYPKSLVIIGKIAGADLI